MTIYENRHGIRSEASGGTGLSRPIGGAGKLIAGTYQCEVVAIQHEPYRALLILATVGSGEIHSDYYVTLPRTLSPGQRVKVTIDYGPGYLVQKNGTSYQAVDSGTRLPRGEWCSDLQTLYEGMFALDGSRPATTEVKEIETDDGTIVRPKVYSPGASTGAPSTEATD